MDTIPGSQVGSKNHTVEKAESPYQSPACFEGAITSLFAPWVVSGVPDPTWQTFQKKLSCLVREMLQEKHHTNGRDKKRQNRDKGEIENAFTKCNRRNYSPGL
jgi:hypothetical protein